MFGLFGVGLAHCHDDVWPFWDLIVVRAYDFASGGFVYSTWSVTWPFWSMRRTRSSVLFRFILVSDFWKRVVWFGWRVVCGRGNGLLPFFESSRVKMPRFTGSVEKFVSSIHSWFPSEPFGFGKISVILSMWRVLGEYLIFG